VISSQDQKYSLNIAETAIEDEIRIVQSVQSISYMPMLLFGNTYGALSATFITWPAPLDGGAVYALLGLLLLMVPMTFSYFRLRRRARPEKVSRRRIRLIVVYSFFLGVAWAFYYFLLTNSLERPDAIALFFLLLLLIYGSVAMIPSIPRASLAYMSPIVMTSLYSAYDSQIISAGWLSLGYFGALSAVGLSMWQNWYDLKRSVRLRLESQLAQRATEQSRQALERVSGQLAKYISPQLYNAVIEGKQKTSIASQRKKLTVFFSDIAGFTELTDQLQPEELTALLNQYLTEMVNIAKEHGANFDKFIGDAIVLYFGDPDTKGVKEDAAACVRMAIAMQHRMRQLQSDWREMGVEKPFNIRIGINTGYCTVGNFGSEDRMDYTIIGAEVNLASRLEYEAEAGGILLANETHSLVKDWLMAEEAKTIEVRGFSRPIKTFSIRGEYDDLTAQGQIIHHQDEGIELTIDRRKLDVAGIDKAEAALKKALEELRE
jgi:class 3 adenylate cyclase